MEWSVGSNRPTIACLSSVYAGAITSVDDLVAGFDKSRYEVIFIYLGQKGQAENHHAKAGFKVIYLTQKRSPRHFSPSLVRRLANVLRDNHVDILHCHAHKCTVYGAMAAAMAHTPLVCGHVHGLGRSRGLRRKVLNYFVHKRVDVLMAVANGVREDIIKNNWHLDPAKVVVLENSIDYDKFAGVATTKAQARTSIGIDAEAVVFGTVGRLAPTKGLGFMLEAFAAVRKRIPNARLAIVGTGPIEADLREAAEKLKVASAVDFVGYRADIEHVMRGFDSFVMSSIAEGMPRVVLEAMASGVPCIATNVGGIPEILNSPDVGLLVPPSDAEALAQAMCKVAGMPAAERQNITVNAGRRVRQVYSHDVIREKLRGIYDGLLAPYGTNLNRGRDR
jgi:glycosyltransferase involved in cell wall biosynthesis